MRAAGVVAAAPLRVDTASFSPAAPAQVLCRSHNLPNGSGCVARQQQRSVGTLSTCGIASFHRQPKVLSSSGSWLTNQNSIHSSSFVCRCTGGGDSEDASSGPQERAGFRHGQSDGDGNGVQDDTADDEAASSSAWDLPARHKRIQAAAAKMGDPLRDMVSSASKRLQDYLDNYKHVKPKGPDDNEDVSEQETEWARWQKVFAEVEECESLSTVLQFQLEEAVEEEDFVEAARLKGALDAVAATDTVAEVMKELKTALEEERYDDATLLRDSAGAGLVGWWVGLAEGGNDPYGRIINIYAAHGRLVAKGYSARQLATATAGVPLFEVFVTRDGEGGYNQQAVYLRRDSNVEVESSSGPSKTGDVNVLDLENVAKENETNDSAKGASEDTAEDGKGKVGDAPLLDEGLSKIMSFLKDRMPDVKLKVFKVIAPEGVEADLPNIVEQLMEQEKAGDNKEEDSLESTASNNNSSSEKKSNLGSQFPLDGKIPVRRATEEEKDSSSMRLIVGGVLQNNIDSDTPKPLVRVPARLLQQSRNAFTFHIEDVDTTAPAGGKENSGNEIAPSWKVATIATQASADLMPDDVAKVLWNVEKAPVKVSKEMGEIIRLAVSQAQRRRGLFKSTSFRRIDVVESSTDPLCGLYIGAFGPYTSEVVQLQRKYGHWESDDPSSSGGNLEFFEYVEAVKLTGDLNVPAGQVTFRARTGRGSRLSHRGAYPEELGVVTRYKGQGRLAEPGFRNPQWIDGELVLLDGKGGGHTNGAALGFIYSVPERHFLVLFKRLNLTD